MDELREGYKKTELECIPEDWQIETLDSIAMLIDGDRSSNYPSPEDIVDQGILFLSTANIKNNKLVYKDCRYITEEKFNSLRKGKLQDKDLIITLRGSIGNVVKFNNNIYETGFINAQMLIIRGKTVDIDYLWNYLISKKCQSRIRVISSGSAQLQLTKKDISSLKVILPTINEQKKISKILSTLDATIDKIEALIEEKKIIKKGLMQQLLTGKKKLTKFNTEKWKEVKLKYFLKPTLRAIEKPKDSYKAIGIRSHGKGTFDKYVEDPSVVSMDTLYEVRENDLIVNITFAWEGAIAIAKKSDEGKLVSHRFPTYVFDTNKVIPEYFKYVIIQPRFIYWLGLISPGGAGRNRVMSKTDFLQLKVKLPSVDEQRAIASILATADKEISLLEEKLEILKEQKKGIMQDLLTGKVRVKV